MVIPKIQIVKPDSTETDSRETPTTSLDRCLVHIFGNRGGRAVTRLAFKRKTRIRCPKLDSTYHSSFHCIYPSYSSSFDGWGCKMAIPCIGAVLRALKRTRVAEFHVSLYPISVSSFFSLYARYMCEYNDLNSLYSAERSYNSNSSSSSRFIFSLSCLSITFWVFEYFGNTLIRLSS